MVGILLSLVPFFAWGTSDYVASKLSKHHPTVVNLMYAIIMLALGGLLAVLFGLPEITREFVWLHFVAAVLVNFGFVVFVKAFSYGIVGPVSSISNAYAVVTAIASAVFLGEVLGWFGWFAIGVVVAGIVAITYEKSNKKGPIVSAPIAWAALSLVLFGLGFFMFDVASGQEWYQDYILFQAISAPIAAILFIVSVPSRGRLAVLKKGFSERIVYAGAFIAGIGTIGFFAAISVTGSATLPAVVSAASPLVTSIWARFVDNERLSILKRAGAVIVVAGVAFLSL